VWDTNHEGKKTQHIRILGNTIVKATSRDLAQEEIAKHGGPPHEAVSIGGAIDFEVAYNHVYDGGTEGIDIKETSKHGKVHHNLVHNLPRQGIYVDAWFGSINDIEISSNVVHDCGGAGVVLSVENGDSVDDVRIDDNLIFNNQGSGLYFSRWGVDKPRRHIEIRNNVFDHNGYGKPAPGQTYYWLTGGLYAHSSNIRDLSIANNIFSDNRGFQIGFSELFFEPDHFWADGRKRGIRIAGNLIHGPNAPAVPIESGGNPPDRVKIYAINGQNAIFGDPMFKDSVSQDFALRRGSPAAKNGIVVGPYTTNAGVKLWWKRNFPPKLFRS
jgi:Right handed beta helix region